jgi:hypothetical protein
VFEARQPGFKILLLIGGDLKLALLEVAYCLSQMNFEPDEIF